MSSLVLPLVLASLGLIIWAIVDVAGKPPGVLSPPRQGGMDCRACSGGPPLWHRRCGCGGHLPGCRPTSVDESHLVPVGTYKESIEEGTAR